MFIILLNIFGVFYYLKVVNFYLLKYKTEMLYFYIFYTLLAIIYLGLSLYILMNLKITDKVTISKDYPQFVHKFYNEKLRITKKRVIRIL